MEGERDRGRLLFRYLKVSVSGVYLYFTLHHRQYLEGSWCNQCMTSVNNIHLTRPYFNGRVLDKVMASNVGVT